jgi:hypothetical protein
MVQRGAELAAIAVLLVGFGAILTYPGLTSESRSAAGVAVVAGLLAVSRLAARRRD